MVYGIQGAKENFYGFEPYSLITKSSALPLCYKYSLRINCCVRLYLLFNKRPVGTSYLDHLYYTKIFVNCQSTLSISSL